MLTRYLALPFILATGVLLYFTLNGYEYYAPYIVPCILVLVVLYFLEPLLNWWSYRVFPPKIDEQLRELLAKHHYFYQNLSLKEKERFRKRMALYMHGVAFTPKGPDSMPEDVKGLITANIIQLTFGREDFLLYPYERVFVYFERFPSPKFPQLLHTSELYEEDSVLLFSAQELIAGITRHKEYYNIGLHEYAHVFTKVFPQSDFPPSEDLDGGTLAKVSNLSLSSIQKTIGLPEIPIIPVSIHHFFTFPDKFKATLPVLFQKYMHIFNLNPLNETNPVVDENLIKAKQ